MLVVGALGLAVNIVALVLLRGGAAERLNVKGAYLQVVADTAGSIGVIVAGWLVVTTGESYWDTVVACAIGAFVAVRAVLLGREVITVLGQHVPAGMETEQITTDLAAIEGVEDVHDLHVWTLTSDMHVATAHLVAHDSDAAQTVLEDARRLLRADHGIEHATLQIETAVPAPVTSSTGDPAGGCRTDPRDQQSDSGPSPKSLTSPARHPGRVCGSTPHRHP